MLQIILALIGMSIVGAFGLVIIQQFTVMDRMQDMRENSRRLDVAAEGLAGSLGRLPGVDTLVPPVPGPSTVGWSTLPASIGAMNQTVKGVPFLYCPVVKVGSSQLAAIENTASTIQMVDDSYNTAVSGQFVVDSSLSYSSDLDQFSPVAFIISAGTRGDQPANCDDIQVVNGKAVVDGGLVRVVSMPSGVASEGTGAEAAAEIWVQDAATGNGRVGSPTTLNSALEHFIRYKPGSMTINVVGENFVSPAVWSRFAAASASSSSKLRIVGHDGGIVDFGASGRWDVPAHTFFENVTIKGPRVVAGTGDTLFNMQTVGYVTYSGEAESIEVGVGGRFVADNANIVFSNTGGTAIISRGDVELRSANISSVGTLSRYISMGPSASLNLVNSTVGTTSSRSTNASIYSYGTGAEYISSDTASVVRAANDNKCWGWANAGDMMFQWSGTPGAANQIGSQSVVVQESDYPRPPSDADPVVQEQYQTEYNQRFLARRLNGSSFTCS